MGLYRNTYLCQEVDHRTVEHGSAMVHHWESFGDKDEPQNCPLCRASCKPTISEWAEHNRRYFALNGYGPGPVLTDGEADPLRSLTNEQIEALLKVILLGDIAEVPQEPNLIGTWRPRGSEDTEGETRMQMAAALVYLSGRMASDLPFMIEPREGKNACYALVCYKCGRVELRKGRKKECKKKCACGGTLATKDEP